MEGSKAEGSKAEGSKAEGSKVENTMTIDFSGNVKEVLQTAIFTKLAIV